MPEIINVRETSGADRYIVQTRDDKGEVKQEILSRQEIESRGGSLPEDVLERSEAHQIGVEQGREARGQYELEKAAARMGMTAEELKRIPSGTLNQQLQQFADKYGMSTQAAIETYNRWKNNPDAPEFKDFNKWVSRDFERAESYAQPQVAQSLAWEKINEANKQNPKIHTTQFINGQQVEVINLEEAVKSGLDKASLYRQVGQARVPTLVKTSIEDKGTLYKDGGWTINQKNINAIKKSIKIKEEAAVKTREIEAQNAALVKQFESELKAQPQDLQDAYNKAKGSPEQKYISYLEYLNRNYTQQGDGWYISNIDLRQQEEYYNNLAEFEKDNTKLPDGQYIQNNKLEDIKNTNSRQYQILTSQGYDAYVSAIEAAKKKLDSYKTKGKYDIAEALLKRNPDLDYAVEMLFSDKVVADVRYKHRAGLTVGTKAPEDIKETTTLPKALLPVAVAAVAGVATPEGISSALGVLALLGMAAIYGYPAVKETIKELAKVDIDKTSINMATDKQTNNVLINGQAITYSEFKKTLEANAAKRMPGSTSKLNIILEALPASELALPPFNLSQEPFEIEGVPLVQQEFDKNVPDIPFKGATEAIVLKFVPANQAEMEELTRETFPLLPPYATTTITVGSRKITLPKDPHQMNYAERLLAGRMIADDLIMKSSVVTKSSDGLSSALKSRVPGVDFDSILEQLYREQRAKDWNTAAGFIREAVRTKRDVIFQPRRVNKSEINKLHQQVAIALNEIETTAAAKSYADALENYSQSAKNYQDIAQYLSPGTLNEINPAAYSLVTTAALAAQAEASKVAQAELAKGASQAQAATKAAEAVKMELKQLSANLVKSNAATKAQAAAITDSITNSMSKVATASATATAAKAATAAATATAATTAATTTTTGTSTRLRFPKGATDKEKRAILKTMEGLIAWRQGEVGGRDVWHVIVYPYESAEDYTTLVGRAPQNSTLVRGAGSAYKTAYTFGKQPSRELQIDMGAQDVKITPRGKVSFTPDPKGLTTGDFSIGLTRGRVFPLPRDKA